MGRKCYVPDCLSEEGRDEDRGVTFHKIPLHADIRPKWLSLCHIPEDKHNYKVIHVCSRHFLKVDFCHFKGKRYMLRQGVLPSVFPWSKLKKENANESTAIKKESESMEMSLDPIIKTEIKEEPVDTSMEVKCQDDIQGEPSCIHTKQLDNRAINEMSSTTIEQKGNSIQTPSGLLNFSVNTQLEALDFNQMWFPAHIVEIDYEENEVLIHFEKYSSKYDEWISMNSSRLRPHQPLPKKLLNTEAFAEGEKVMASWSDARKFPATITKVLGGDTYEVLFNDGFIKVLKGHRIVKTHGKVGSAPLFDPATGTKQDRRNKKRKINVAQLFRKRLKADTSEESQSPTTITHPDVSGGEETDGWTPKWENGKPVGTESVIEAHDGIRKSIIVSDPRLPPNWTKHLVQKSTGVAAGKWDTIIVRYELETNVVYGFSLNYP